MNPRSESQRTRAHERHQTKMGLSAFLLSALVLVAACAPIATPTTEPTATLVVNVAPVSAGRVEVLPTGPGESVYPQGETLTLTAIPNDGFAFERWDGAVTGVGTDIVLLLEADATVEALFRAIDPPVRTPPTPTPTTPSKALATATPTPTAEPAPQPTAEPAAARTQARLASESTQVGRTFDVAVWVDPAGASVGAGTISLTYPAELLAFTGAAIASQAASAYSLADGPPDDEGLATTAIVLNDGATALDAPSEFVLFTFFATQPGLAEFVPELGFLDTDSSPIVTVAINSDPAIIEPRPSVAATCFTTTSALTWSDPDGLQVMQIERRDLSGAFFQRAVVVAGEGQFNDDRLSTETTYEYRLTATVLGGGSGVALATCTTDDGRVPLIPAAADVSARREEAGLVVTLIDWSACNIVEWGDIEETVAGTFVGTAQMWEATSDTRCESRLATIATHTYLLANNATGSLIFEAWGETVDEFTLTSTEGDDVAAPVLFLTVDEASAVLTWQHDKVNVDHFTLDRTIGTGQGYTNVESDIQAQVGSILDANLFPGTAYCWRVRAVTARGTRSEAAELCSETKGLTSLIFASDREGDLDIYTMLADGSAQVRINTNAGDDIEPVWSPDRTMIAFSSRRSGTWDIWVMDADGSSPKQLTFGGSNDWAPAWSPDGSKIAWSAFRDGDPEIYVMDASGSGQTRLTIVQGEDTNPSWSPDGTKIAFDSRRDGNKEIYVMNADGSNQVRLTNNPAKDVEPTWSPSGNKIAFTRDSQIFLINPGGGGEHPLTSSDGKNQAPSWSRDGTQILFESSRDGDSEIYVMDIDGANEVPLTTNDSIDVHPDW